MKKKKGRETKKGEEKEEVKERRKEKDGKGNLTYQLQSFKSVTKTFSHFVSKGVPKRV